MKFIFVGVSSICIDFIIYMILSIKIDIIATICTVIVNYIL